MGLPYPSSLNRNDLNGLAAECEVTNNAFSSWSNDHEVDQCRLGLTYRTYFFFESLSWALPIGPISSVESLSCALPTGPIPAVESLS